MQESSSHLPLPGRRAAALGAALCLLVLDLEGGARAGDDKATGPGDAAVGHEQPPSTPTSSPGQWILDAGCDGLCPTFTDHAGQKVTADQEHETQLKAPGILNIYGPTRIRWRVGDEESVFDLERGPGSWALGADGSYEPLGSAAVRKKGTSPGAKLQQAAFKGASIDTRYRAYVTAGGALCLELTWGAVDVSLAAGPEIRVGRGEGVVFEPRVAAGAKPTLEVMHGRSLRAACDNIRLTDEARPSRVATGAEAALAAFVRELPNLEGPALSDRALSLRARYPGTLEVSRILYVAWRAAYTRGDKASARLLADALVTDYPGSPWVEALPPSVLGTEP